MDRRTFLLGTATASGIAVTTGAAAIFSGASERSATVDVVNDARGLIGLIANDSIAGVRETATGELTIELTGSGVNTNAIYQFGQFVDDDGDPTGEGFDLRRHEDPTRVENGSFGSAFLVANQSTGATTVQLDIESDETALGDTEICFELHHDGERVGTIDRPGQGTTAVADLRPGEAFGVSFVVNSTEGAVDDELSATIRVAAGDAVEGDRSGETPTDSPIEPAEGVFIEDGVLVNESDYRVFVDVLWYHRVDRRAEFNGETTTYELAPGDSTVLDPSGGTDGSDYDAMIADVQKLRRQ